MSVRTNHTKGWVTLSKDQDEGDDHYILQLLEQTGRSVIKSSQFKFSKVKSQ